MIMIKLRKPETCMVRFNEKVRSQDEAIYHPLFEIPSNNELTYRLRVFVTGVLHITLSLDRVSGRKSKRTR